MDHTLEKEEREICSSSQLCVSLYECMGMDIMARINRKRGVEMTDEERGRKYFLELADQCRRIGERDDAEEYEELAEDPERCREAGASLVH